MHFPILNQFLVFFINSKKIYQFSYETWIALKLAYADIRI